MATLRPCKEESVNFDETENLYIEGDNLEVIKVLQKSYYNKIKMIYIDPPYNTGHDFVYNDDFKNPLDHYKEITSQTTKSNLETMGRFHTAWLNMMLPRLRLAANLLREDGVIFISIDDHEVHNLRKICDEVFGEENFVGCAGRITKKSNNKGDFWAPNFDYILTYVKNTNSADSFLGEANISAYNLEDPTGSRAGEKYQLVRLYMSSLQNRNPDQRFWIECPDGSKIIPPGKTFPPQRPVLGDGIWRWTKNKFEKEKDKIVIKQVKSSNLIDQNGNPAKWNVYTKTYLNDVLRNSSAKPNNFIEKHINQIGSHELNDLNIPFDYSKPTTLIKYLMSIAQINDNDIVLDFFSGSATTAHAVMELNKEDGGNRKFIMVQLPELCDEKSEAFKAGYKNICEIGKERIRRAGEKLLEKDNQISFEENKKPLDVGFKVFKLDSSNLKAWDSSPIDKETYDDYEQLKLEFTKRFDEVLDRIKPDRSDLDVVYEVMFKLGIEPTEKITKMDFDGKVVYSVREDCLLLVCLDNDVQTETVEKMAELAPAYMVFSQHCFKDVSSMSNIKLLLKRKKIEMKFI